MRRGRDAHQHGRRRKASGGGAHTVFAERRYRLITTDDPCRTLGHGEVRHFGRLTDACVAFVKSPSPYKQLVFDDGCEARFLNRDEQWVLESICGFHGYDVEEHDYAPPEESA
jgi:hypothetical protein